MEGGGEGRLKRVSELISYRRGEHGKGTETERRKSACPVACVGIGNQAKETGVSRSPGGASLPTPT